MAKVNKRLKEVVKKEEVKSMVLSNHELLQVETSPLMVENSKLLMALEEQALANMILELKLLSSKIDKQKSRVAECGARHNHEKLKYDSTIAGIMENHGLKNAKFSYNNNTGEIIP